MKARMLNRFSRHASYLTPIQVRRIVEEASGGRKPQWGLVFLWLALRSGARLCDMLMLRTDEAWDGYVPVWRESAEKVLLVGVCKNRQELEWLREQLTDYRIGCMAFDVEAKVVNRWINTVCRRAGVNIENGGGYAAVIRPYDDRRMKTEEERAKETLI